MTWDEKEPKELVGVRCHSEITQAKMGAQVALSATALISPRVVSSALIFKAASAPVTGAAPAVAVTQLHIVGHRATNVRIWMLPLSRATFAVRGRLHIDRHLIKPSHQSLASQTKQIKMEQCPEEDQTNFARCWNLSRWMPE